MFLLNNEFFCHDVCKNGKHPAKRDFEILCELRAAFASLISPKGEIIDAFSVLWIDKLL
jgi:hypothetical protein